MLPRIWRSSVKTVSPFLDLNDDRPLVPVWFEGRELSLPKGANLAAALLCAGITTFRHTPATGAPRAPFCMMGACFDCLVEIDGVTQQACMIDVSEGLRVSNPHQTTGGHNANPV